MWQVENRTPFAVDRAWVRDREGAEVWLVAVKASFDVDAAGGCRVSSLQPPVLHVPEYHGEPGGSSIKYGADLVLTKTTTDIVVVGSAHAPQGRQVVSLDVGVRVGSIRKVLTVFGDRTWGAFGIGSPLPFSTMPITYERAFGGADAAAPPAQPAWEIRNPVGVGYAPAKGQIAGSALPNVESADRLIRSRSDRPAPAGFGAIDSHWQPRAAFVGTYGDEWMKTRHPLLPDDFDERFFQIAPPDQQAPKFMLGGEEVTLLNLSPLGTLRFTLPRLHLGFETSFYDGSREVHLTRNLHTVILEPDLARLSLVWHSALPCHFKVHKLNQTVVTLKRELQALVPAGAMKLGTD